MALLDRLTLLIDADGSRAVGELNRLGRVTKDTLSVGQKFGRDFFSGLGLGAGAVSGLAAANALKSFAQFSIEAAQAAENDARSQIVLKKALENTAGATGVQVQAVEDYISATSRSVGVLDDELRPALATLVRSTNDAATAQRLLTLSLDISAGTGRDVGTVSLALAKAWEGQTTALGRLLPEVGGLVREGASAAEVFNQLQRTFGGTAKESSSQAGSFNRLKVALDDMAESYGRNLAPAIEEAAVAAQELAKWQERGTAFAGRALTLAGGTGTALRDSIAQQKSMREQLQLLEGRLDRVADAGGAFSGVLQKLGYGTLNYRDEVTATSSSVLGFAASLKEAESAANGFLNSIFGVSSAEDKFNDAIESTSQSTGGAARATRDLIAEQFNRERSARSVMQAEIDLLDAEKELEEVRKGASEREKKRAALDVASADNRVKQAQQRIADATNALNKATGRRGNAQDAARARQDLADALLEQEQAQMDLADTQDRANETTQRGTEGSKDLADATKRVEDAQWGLKEAIEAQRQAAQQDQTDGGAVGRSARQQRDAFREATTAATGIITAMNEAGAPTDVINGKIAEMVLKLQDAGSAAGLTKKEIQDAADLLVAFGAVAQATKQQSLTALYGFGATTLREELDAMRRQGIYVPDIAYQLAGGRAGGGSMNAGQTYRVGERGPETLTMGNSPGWMTPNSGGGTVINFNGTVVADKANLERLVFEALQSAQRRGWN